ncbi:MAG TPA: hypothetical protein VNJ01_12595 [Bacteriovoracaceae bacterium]|nr:hypothetical protein [Bacteriovoracaceae bacterium]
MFKSTAAAVLLLAVLSQEAFSQTVRCFGARESTEEVCLELGRNSSGKQITTVRAEDAGVRISLGEFTRNGLRLESKRPIKSSAQSRLKEIGKIEVSSPWMKAKKIMLFTEDEAEMGELYLDKTSGVDPEVGIVGTPTEKPGRSSLKIEQESYNFPGVSGLRTIEQDPVDPRRLYAVGLLFADRMGTSNSMLYVSKDGGQTWEESFLIRNGARSFSSVSISGDGKKIAVIGSSVQGKTAEIHYSTDRGETFSSFEHVPSTDTVSYGGRISHTKVESVHVTSDGRYLYVGEGRGVITKYSWDRSQILALKKFPMLIQDVAGVKNAAAAYNMSTHPEAPGKIFVGTGNLVFRLDEKTGDYVVFRPGVYNDSTIYNIEFLKDKGLRMSTCNSVYQTQPGSDFRSEAVPKFIRRRSGSFINDKGSVINTPSYIRTYWVQSNPYNSSEVLAGTTSGLYHSVDGSVTWKRLLVLPDEGSRKISNSEYHRIIFIDKDNIVVMHRQPNKPQPHMSRIKLR